MTTALYFRGEVVWRTSLTKPWVNFAFLRQEKEAGGFEFLKKRLPG